MPGTPKEAREPAWGCTSVIPGHRRQREGGNLFQTSLDYIIRPFLKTTKSKHGALQSGNQRDEVGLQGGKKWPRPIIHIKSLRSGSPVVISIWANEISIVLL